MRLLLLVGLGLPLAAGDSITFPLPSSWEGKKDGATEGNPALPGGSSGIKAPVWRADRIWPGDPQTGKNWEPMPWATKPFGFWHPAKNQHGYRPAIRLLDPKNLVLSVASAWPGGGDGDGSKIPALVFIAPGAARYAFQGEAEVKRDDGSGVLTFTIWKREPGANLRVTQQRQLEAKGAKAAIQHPPVALGKGDELALVPTTDLMNTAFTITLKNLVVVATP